MHNTFSSKHFWVWECEVRLTGGRSDQDKKPDAAKPVKRCVSIANE